MFVTNSLIRIVSPRSSLPQGFERARPDLDIYVGELPADLMIGVWEPEAIKVMREIKEANCACERLVLFVETVGDSPACFSNELLRSLVDVAGSLEHYAGGYGADDETQGQITESAILDAVELFERDRTASPELATALQRFARDAEVSDPLVGTAIWALGKRFDTELKSFFVDMLERTYQTNPHAGYQCMIALDNLNEDILPGGGSAMEIQRNTGLAEAYLRKHGARQGG